MKYKTSVSFSEETILGIREVIKLGRFRNKSHVVEYAVNKLLEDSKND